MPPPVRNQRSPLPTGTQPSSICPTDPRLWYVPNHVLCGRRDQPVILTSPVIEQTIVQLATITSPLGRSLRIWETDLIHSIFGSSVDTARIRVVEARIANAPTTLGNQIRVTPGWDFDTPEHRGVLIHECTHIWQYQSRGTDYITDALYHQLSSMIATPDRNSAYLNYRFDERRNFSEYSAEEQATMVEDYYQLTVRYAGLRNDEVPEWVVFRRPDLPKYEPFIRQVRSTVPLAPVEIYERSLMTVPAWNMNSPTFVPDRDVIQVVPLLRLQWR